MNALKISIVIPHCNNQFSTKQRKSVVETFSVEMRLTSCKEAPMNTQIRNLVLGFGALVLIGCGSMHPPTTNPYFPGYHARDAQQVEEEYQGWEQEQARLEERARVRDSLNAEYEDWYREWLLNGNFSFLQYNFYDDWRPFYGYHHRRYRPYSGWNFNFRYSTQPLFVDTWWADDYLWDQYFWGSRGYSYPYYNTYDPFFNPYYYNSSYTSFGYYNPFYGYGHHRYPKYYYVIDDETTPSGPRPGNRDIFSRGGGGAGSTTPSINNANTIRPVNPHRPGERSITPAVIDRDKIKASSIPLRRPSSRGKISTQSGDSDDNDRDARPAGRSFSSPKSSSSGGSTSTTSVRSSSGNSGSSESSSSSGDSSKKSKKRPKDRKH